MAYITTMTYYINKCENTLPGMDIFYTFVVHKVYQNQNQ